MAFGQGQITKEADFKKYIGVASVTVLGVNPKKEELEKLYGRPLDKEPEYMGVTEINDKEVKYIRLDFIVKVVPDKYVDNNGKFIDFISKVSFFLRDKYNTNKDETKTQVIDSYGRTAWVTNEQLRNHEIPMYKNGPANISNDYREAYVGEEELTKFLIAYINIPSPQKWINEQWVMKTGEELSKAEARLDHIEDYIKGDITELKDILSYQPMNKVKILFGVRTGEENRQYQTVYTRMFLKNGVKDYARLSKDVKDTQESGALSTSEFDCTDLHEYMVVSTDFNNPTSAQDPFAQQNTSPWEAYAQNS